MSALLPCPWPRCGSLNLTVATGKTCFVVCDACGARGPRVFTADDARAAWNRRTPPPLPTREALTAALAVVPTGLRNQAMHLPPAMAEAAADAVLRLLGGENGDANPR